MNKLTRILLSVAGAALVCDASVMLDATVARRTLGSLIVAFILLFFPSRKILKRFSTWTDGFSDAKRRWVAVLIFIASAGYFAYSGWRCQRAFHPTWHDDQMHAVQTRMLSRGYLWMKPHPLPEFFDTFHILMTPVYAPIHFPGTAMLNVPGAWLDLPTGIIPLLLVAAACSITFLILFELINGTYAFLAVALIWASPAVRTLATNETSHNAMIFLGALSIWLFMQWQKRRTLSGSVALSIACSWALITRPVDAMAFAIPIGIGVLLETFRHRPRKLNHLIVMFACAMPFLALQLCFDHAITGSWLTPPYKYYNDRFYPQTNFAGDRPADENARPLHVSDLPQKQLFYETFALRTARELIERGIWIELVEQRIPMTFLVSLPNLLLVFFIPFAFIGFDNARKWIASLPAVLLFVLYLPNIYYFAHYAPVIMTSIVVLQLFGIRVFCQKIAFKMAAMEPFLLMTLALSSIASITPFSLHLGFEFTTNVYRAVNFAYERLPQRVQQPALVFCRFDPQKDSPLDEPVYNISTANPDDAKIVLAQDLGDHDIALIRYYHDLGQNRHVYVFVRTTLKLIDLGTVNDILSKQPATTRSIDPPPGA